MPDISDLLVDIEQLDLSGNRLGHLPEWIWRLGTLKELNLTGNLLNNLPSDLGNLTRLERLDLYHNRLPNLPNCFESLDGLEFLGLSRNRLRSLPSSISQLVNLRFLHLGHNLLDEIPSQVEHLGRLYYLGIGGNRITSIPEWIGAMPGLVDFRAPENQIGSIPDSVGRSPSLKEVTLYSNRIQSVPASLGTAPVLETINLDENPLSSHYAIPYRAGSEGFLAYLRALSRGYRPRREAKVLVLGEGETGKTTLVHRLKEGTFRESGTSTHGIEVDHLDLFDDNSVSLNFWDFGGQEVYRITHQFFYSTRAIYLLVWKPRTGVLEGAVEDWLKRIRLRAGPDAKVIIVATHGDERRPEIDLAWLKREFGDLIVDSVTVDSKSGSGFGDLKASIVKHASSLDHMDMPWPNSWTAASRDLMQLAERKPQVVWDEFVEICSAKGVAQDECGILAELLDHFGHVVYWGDDPTIRDLVILQPEWLTKAISYVLEDENTRSADGVLRYDQVGRIWGTEELSEDFLPAHYPYFLRLMERFDVSYRIEGQRAAIVGQLVPHSRPNGVAAFVRNVAGLPRLHATCEMSEEPPGVMPWMIVRTNRDWTSPTTHWRRGVCLSRPKYQSYALVEQMDPTRLDLTVWAPAPDFYFHVLLDTFERLAERWPGLSWELLMACPSRVEGGQPCAGKFRLSTLQKARWLGRSEVTCHECLEEVDVLRLLTGLDGFGVSGDQEVSSEVLESIAGRLATIQGRLDEVAQSGERTLTVATQLADGMRGLFRFFSEEVRDTPRLISLERLSQGQFNPRRFFLDRYRLSLWCEHEDDRHRVGSYDFTASREWWVEASTYIRYAQIVLRGVPMVRAVVDLSLDGGPQVSQDDIARLSGEIHLMEAIGDLDVIAAEQSAVREFKTEHELLRSGARRVRALLLELDQANEFWGLRRTPVTPTGDFYWVCAEHMGCYDPGLPELS